MSKPISFMLRNEASGINFGTVTFNGKFEFVLDKTIPTELWNRVGFIPLKGNENKIESNELFIYLNTRLPIDLRDKSAEAKIDYISKTGLKVASDSFRLVPA
jgi:hypothetical protein